jgi:hypothetical protein
LPSRPRSPGAHGCRELSTLKLLQTQAPADLWQIITLPWMLETDGSGYARRRLIYLYFDDGP